MENLLVERLENLAILTVQRPKQYNALNLATIDEMGGAIDRLSTDEALRALIITGAGDKAFVAGADTRQLESLDVAGAKDLSRRGNAVFRKIERFPTPVIAAVNGFALGGGCELALSCDLRLAAENAVFGLPEVTLGILPGWGGSQRLRRAVGHAAAAEMMLGGGKVDAQRALALGLVSRVVAAEKLMEEALALAKGFAANAPLAVRAAKKLLVKGADVELDEALGMESEAFSGLFASRDAKEGLAAFNNRQPYEFEGR